MWRGEATTNRGLGACPQQAVNPAGVRLHSIKFDELMLRPYAFSSLLGCTIALSLCQTVVFKMSYSVSNTASPPWIGMHICIIKGKYKAYHGYVHHVNPSNLSISRLKIVVELLAHTYNGTNSLVTVEYDGIREFEHWRTLAEVQPLGLYQTSYNLRPDYFPPQLDVPYIPQPGPEVVPASPHHFLLPRMLLLIPFGVFRSREGILNNLNLQLFKGPWFPQRILANHSWQSLKGVILVN
ncbi:hypothetical protein C8J55DRAFT_490259 [Lentinula edodes]|uniref:Uncharacterized protein n=1 Tax=Lentinula lateritia TaxID=40482 RepID=A0A9W9DLE7_9AGAR|nr:hypothetical protein C8J55DRAFT_490259 [Lentinula edodes]